MRQFASVVVLVAGAFLGGTLISGPGLRWAQQQALNALGLKDGGEIASINLSPVPEASVAGAVPPPPIAGEPMAVPPSIVPNRDPDRSDSLQMHLSDSSASGTQAPADEFRETKPTPLGSTTDPGSTRPSTGSPPGSPSTVENLLELFLEDVRSPGQTTTSPAHSPNILPGPSSPPSVEAPSVPNSPSQLAVSGPPRSHVDPSTTTQDKVSKPESSIPNRDGSSAQPAPLDPGVASAILASLSPSRRPAAPASPAGASKPLPLEANPSPRSPVSAAPPSAGQPPPFNVSVPRDDRVESWSTIRERLKSLGVTRYTVEAELSGRVVMACLIPVAGRHSVTQRFEGDGNDEFEASRVVLHRITLWQAARRAAPPPPSPR
jgi:hypothetical protein